MYSSNAHSKRVFLEPQR